MADVGKALAGGTVTITGQSFAVQELPIEAEIGFRAQLRAAARDAFGPGSFYANVLPVARWAREQGEGQDAATLVASVAPMIAGKSGSSDDAAEMYRQSPDGVAAELYFRSRKAHPDVSLIDFRKCINQVNALEVYQAIIEAIAPGKT